MPVANLGPKAKEALFQLVYWLNESGELEDPTESMPNGINTGVLTLSILELPIIDGWSSADGQLVSRPMDAGMLGTALAKGSSWWEQSASEFQAWDRFRIGVNKKYSLKLVTQPKNIALTFQFSETFFDPKAQTLDKLPPEISTEVELARQRAASQPSRPPATTTPPPR